MEQRDRQSFESARSCDKKFRDSLALTASDDQVDVEAKHEDDRDHVPRPNSVDSGAQKDESWRKNGASKSVWFDSIS